MKVLAVLGVGVGMLMSTVVGLALVVAAVGVTGAVAPPPPTVAGIPAVALAAYERAATACPGLSWTVLAGIGEMESDHGRSTAPGVQSGANSAGAEGPMQFLPATFAAYAVARPDGTAPSPYDIGDAALAAARLLCADGAAGPAHLRDAIWHYNHSWDYVDAVLAWAAQYARTA